MYVCRRLSSTKCCEVLINLFFNRLPTISYNSLLTLNLTRREKQILFKIFLRVWLEILKLFISSHIKKYEIIYNEKIDYFLTLSNIQQLYKLVVLITKLLNFFNIRSLHYCSINILFIH